MHVAPALMGGHSPARDESTQHDSTAYRDYSIQEEGPRAVGPVIAEASILLTVIDGNQTHDPGAMGDTVKDRSLPSAWRDGSEQIQQLLGRQNPQFL